MQRTTTVLALLPLLAAPGLAASELPYCERSMAEVREKLLEEPPMRDEAYTAIMLQQLEAEKAIAAADDAACVAALEVARLILGLPPAESP